MPVRHDRVNNVGAGGLDADDLRLPAEPRPDEPAPAGAAAAADRDEHDVGVRQVVENLERVGRDTGNQQRLVGRVHIAQAVGPLQLLDALARLVEVAPELHDVGAERAHGRVLVGVVAEWNDNRARHTFALARERNRLPVVAGRGGDDAAPLVGGEVRDQIQPAADLEGARRIVVLVLDVEREPGLRVEQRVPQERRRLERAVDDCPSGVNVGKSQRHGRQRLRPERGAKLGRALINANRVAD